MIFLFNLVFTYSFTSVHFTFPCGIWQILNEETITIIAIGVQTSKEKVDYMPNVTREVIRYENFVVIIPV